jgi:diguanylate cyclase (GGDEF)-like protein/PAS domain S-box-containing protein
MARLLAALRRNNAELRQREDMYRSMFDNVPVGLYRTTPAGDILDMNKAAVEMLGYPSREALLQCHALDLYVDPSDRQRWQSLLKTQGEVHKFEMQFRRYDGSIIWVLDNVRSIRDAAGNLIAYEGSIEDITARKQAELALWESESRYRAVSELTSDFAFALRIEADGFPVPEWITDAFTRITGLTHEDAKDPAKMSSIVHPDDIERLLQHQAQVMAGHNPGIIEFRILRHGEVRWLRHYFRPIWDMQAGRLVRIYGAAQDITEYRQYDQQIEHLAFTDPLTGLPNRRHLYAMGEETLTAARRRVHTVALLYLDLDRFKAFNDTLGHDAGDELLIQVARRLKQGLADNALLARIGGDEFAVLLPDATIKQATDAAHRLLDYLQKPLDLRGQHVYLSGSIGISLGPLEDLPFSTLLTRADIAMYRAKGNRSSVQVYDPAHSTLLPDQMRLETDLRWALATNGLKLHYQPIFDPLTSQIVGAEALVRWPHPTRGLLMPGSFLPLAEDAGLMRMLDSWVLEAAIHQAAQWYAAGHPWQVAINLTAYSLQHMELVTEVSELLAIAEVPPERIIIELTEQTALHDIEVTRQVLCGLHKLGLKIALDDFGNGYASLSHVQHLPVDILKVDRAFTAGLGQDSRDETVVRALLGLGSGMDMIVIIEGVERAEQLAWLNGSEGVWVQGYLIGKPAPPEQMHGKQRTASRLHP